MLRVGAPPPRRSSTAATNLGHYQNYWWLVRSSGTNQPAASAVGCRTKIKADFRPAAAG